LPTEIIARTGDRFSGFGPYVASINDAGHVAFWGDGQVFVWRGSAEPEPVDLGGEVISHPDIDAAGRVCAYVRLDSGETAVVLDARVLDSGDIGPLGPTMNDRGQVAYRARGGVYSNGDQVARRDDRFASFEGLPCVDDTGAVVFRADHGIYRWRGGQLETLVETGGDFAELGRFPAVGPGGEVVFAAQTGVFAIDRDGLRALHAGGFASYRGVLAHEGGFVFYATPPGGAIGIYDGAGRRLLGVDDEIAAFVLNPVSINRSGQLAIRLELTDGTGAIARFSPWQGEDQG
jgi:hypothetical protein